MSERRLKKEKWIRPDTHLSVGNHTINEQVSLHLHEYYELEIVLEGCGEQNLNGSVYPLSPGTVYLITPIDFHSVSPNGSLTICNISFDETLISPALQLTFLNRRENLIFSAAEELGFFTALTHKLTAEERLSDAYAQQMRQNILSLLLLTIARRDARQSSIQTLSSRAVHSSMQYLFQHFRHEITLDEVAAQSGYTANYFSHLFHRISGQRYVDFLNRLRLNYAKMILLTTDTAVSAIAEASGFSSQSNFFRIFRKELGASPQEYRRLFRSV